MKIVESHLLQNASEVKVVGTQNSLEVAAFLSQVESFPRIWEVLPLASRMHSSIHYDKDENYMTREEVNDSLDSAGFNKELV